MSNNCLVTKLKGTVDNPDLPVYGEIILNLANEPLATRNFYMYAGNEPVKFEYIGATATDGVQSGTIAPGVGRNFEYTGSGTIKISPKYQIPTLELNVSVSYAPDVAYYMGCYIGTAGNNVWDHVEKEVKIKQYHTYHCTLPLIKDGDYSKITLGTIEHDLRFSYHPGSADVYNISSDALQNAINKMREVADQVKNIVIWETSSVIDLTTLADFTNMTNFTVHNVTFTGDIVECFKPLISLTSLTIQKKGDATKWDATPLFNYWAANGKTGTFNCWIEATAVVGGTIVDIPYGSMIVFSNGSWSIQ